MEGKTCQLVLGGEKRKEDIPLRLRGRADSCSGGWGWGERCGGVGGVGAGAGGTEVVVFVLLQSSQERGLFPRGSTAPLPSTSSRDLWAASGQMCPLHAMTAGLSQCWRAACF